MKNEEKGITALTIQFDADFRQKIEEYRATMRPIPSSGETIRRLAKRGLETLHKEAELRPA